MPFDDACQRLRLPSRDMAMLLLRGYLDFRVSESGAVRVARTGLVSSADVEVSTADVEREHTRMWADPAADVALADKRVNMAALRWGRHPTRTGRGVRGRGRKFVDGP